MLTFYDNFLGSSQKSKLFSGPMFFLSVWKICNWMFWWSHFFPFFWEIVFTGGFPNWIWFYTSFYTHLTSYSSYRNTFCCKNFYLLCLIEEQTEFLFLQRGFPSWVWLNMSPYAHLTPTHLIGTPFFVKTSTFTSSIKVWDQPKPWFQSNIQNGSLNMFGPKLFRNLREKQIVGVGNALTPPWILWHPTDDSRPVFIKAGGRRFLFQCFSCFLDMQVSQAPTHDSPLVIQW